LLVATAASLVLLLVAYNTDALGGAFEQGTAAGVVLWLIAAAAAIGTLVTGIVSWFRFKDHSIVVIVATVLGVVATVLFAIGANPQA
jgi:hypothetical protein